MTWDIQQPPIGIPLQLLDWLAQRSHSTPLHYSTSHYVPLQHDVSGYYHQIRHMSVNIKKIKSIPTDPQWKKNFSALYFTAIRREEPYKPSLHMCSNHETWQSISKTVNQPSPAQQPNPVYRPYWLGPTGPAQLGSAPLKLT